MDWQSLFLVILHDAHSQGLKHLQHVIQNLPVPFPWQVSAAIFFEARVAFSAAGTDTPTKEPPRHKLCAARQGRAPHSRCNNTCLCRVSVFYWQIQVQLLNRMPKHIHYLSFSDLHPFKLKSIIRFGNVGAWGCLDELCPTRPESHLQ